MEPNLIVNLAAALVFGAIAAYVLLLAFRQAHGTAVSARTAELEQQLLRGQLQLPWQLHVDMPPC